MLHDLLSDVFITFPRGSVCCTSFGAIRWQSRISSLEFWNSNSGELDTFGDGKATIIVWIKRSLSLDDDFLKDFFSKNISFREI